MPNTTGLAVKVGIFVVAALIALIGFSLRVSEDLKGKEVYTLSAYFDDALGLEEGADVSLGGLRIGRLDNLSFDPARKSIVASLAVSADYQLPADSTAVVERSALLGNSIIVIEYGDEKTFLSPDSEIATRKQPGLSELVDSITGMSTDARELMDSLKKNQDEVFQKIDRVIEENRDDFRQTSSSMASAGPKLEKLADNLNEITENMKAGKGTIGKLYSDESLYNDLKNFSEEANKITADLREGEGTLSKLLYDDSLAKKAEESFDKLGSAGDEVQAVLSDHREDIKKMIDSLSNVGPQIDEAVANMQQITDKINNGEGTLGKLVNDPSLYNDTKKTMNQVGESFESSEEQGVIRSFIGIIFGAMI